VPSRIRYKINKGLILPEFIIYKLTFPNGKLYIGCTKYYEQRMSEHKRAKSIQPKLSRAIKKYGWENVKSEIIFNCKTYEEMLQKETEFIKFYNSVTEGYNCTSGGEGCILSEETLQKHITFQGSPEVRKRKSEVSKQLMKNPEYKAKAINNFITYANSDAPSKNSEKTLSALQS
jgi:group I intron endonuclease